MSKVPNCFYRISIKALIKNGSGMVLLAKNKNGQWEIPGGGLDFGEKPKECLIREMKEELGLNINQVSDGPLSFATVKDKNGVWKAVLLFEVSLKDLNFTQSEECREFRFFSKDNALKEDCHPMTIGVLKDIDEKLLWETYLSGP